MAEKVNIDPELLEGDKDQFVANDPDIGMVVLQATPLRAVNVNGGYVWDGETVRKLSVSDTGEVVARCLKTGDEEYIPDDAVRQDGSIHGVLDVMEYDALTLIN